MDLFTTQYSLEILAKNIYALPLKNILKTQKLTARFVAHYILNPQYQLTKEEEEITITDVLFFQPHLTLSEIFNEQALNDKLLNDKLLNDKLLNDQDIEDFETVSNRN